MLWQITTRNRSETIENENKDADSEGNPGFVHQIWSTTLPTFPRKLLLLDCTNFYHSVPHGQHMTY